MRTEDTQRASSYPERAQLQAASLRLPFLPTTTIGSFPQTESVRAARAKFKKGEYSTAQYEGFLEAEIRKCIRQQEELGIDVLVHGEFERNDMVEYFGQQLSGFAFTENGWVQSYGSRCVKPPIILGDVSRPRPMTVRWAKFAQALTPKPVKGMLTGPITLLQWSFVRDDQPRSQTASQIALAVRDEVLELEAAGIRIIQIDEPALREGLPLRRANWAAYLKWAAEAFRLATAGVKDSTQIHTHMCYSEFSDVIDAIAALDADVISIETSRSNMDLLQTFVTFRYPNQIGPGVWDIHSPRLPSTDEMLELLRTAMKVIPSERLWVNPDCGLKTRRWEEVTPALKNLVAAAEAARRLSGTPTTIRGAHPPLFMKDDTSKSKSHRERTTNSVPNHGCCGSHSEILSASLATSSEGLKQGVLDVRLLPPARRHSLIFQTFDGLSKGSSFELINDHDPKPLYYQFTYEKAGTFTWNYEEQGPEVWRVRIGKTEIQTTLKSANTTIP